MAEITNENKKRNTKIFKCIITTLFLLGIFILFDLHCVDVDIKIKNLIIIPIIIFIILSVVLLIFSEKIIKFEEDTLDAIIKRSILGLIAVLIFSYEHIATMLSNYHINSNISMYDCIHLLVNILVGIITIFFLPYTKEILFDKTTDITPSPISNADSGKQPVSTQADSNAK